ncbi:hypothetical protein A4H97_32340 [Niastella yeongjuensis]|uniref:HTH araC/xylS-type domain-containing protein n=1 Tax=Niastella yeongjuensis TaxID=354355 RepID=A0A1V9EH45_9BACT|nr:AraC family transcriptional regulator [Niastella yeongjuensis]OQP45436.1 hypothetical protein A4H97_32340 [Niastella yeongjuensis]SEO75793.1 AraC-type DNA-binding protein [Niastella yeongjuensis]
MKTEKLFKRHVLQAVTCYKELLDEHCANGDPAHKLSLQMGVSRNVLQQGFRKLFGESIREYKLRIRMERGRTLFDLGKDLKDVAHELNYTKTRAFTTAFKRFYGHTPTKVYNVLG